MSIFTAILGDPNERSVKAFEKKVAQINALESHMREFSDVELQAQTGHFRERLQKGEKLDDLLPEAFASVREAARRTLGQRHFDVQLIGGMVLHEGKISEMRTGEGKTLTATLAVYLNALEGKGAHVVTVNDYLARRDAVWMGQIYWALGMSVGCINHDTSFLYDPEYKITPTPERDEVRDTLGSFKVEDSYLRPANRREAYRADITYGTNNEYGFDYLRDNMAQSAEGFAQRTEEEGGLHFAIVDEVDSILIDEARTPLIISAPDTESGELYKTFSRIVPALKENDDYNVDEKMRAVSITEEGITKVEQRLGVVNLYDPLQGGGVRYAHHLEQALKAHILFHRDKDYVIKNGEVIIVDEFTGRLMPGRRYSEGLHQAIEAKEGVQVQKESRTLATITFQNYFRMYAKLAGMTGTAYTNAEEFDKVYKLDVVRVPTNKPMVRADLPDLIFRTQAGKLRAIAKEIKKRHDLGQPVLVGTTSIEKNEVLSALLSREGIPFEMLNAKQHEREGGIIAQAGRMAQTTVATNMAGRGVDIILGGNPPVPEQTQKVRELGGLHIIGTERHEARRIDDQLRGRAGRQGDPGSSQFFLSLEDDIMRIFGGDRIRGLMETLHIPEDEPIESRLVSGAIENAQQKIEGYNFDLRKHVLDYDEVLNKQRQTIYRKRRQILFADAQAHEEVVRGMVEEYATNLCDMHASNGSRAEWNMEELGETMKALGHFDQTIHEELLAIVDNPQRDDNEVRAELQKFVQEKLMGVRAELRKTITDAQWQGGERFALLRTFDMFWMDHLDAMDYLRDSVRLRAYGQKDPLTEYKSEGSGMFRELLSAISQGAVSTIFHMTVRVMPSVAQQTTDNRQQTTGVLTPHKGLPSPLPNAPERTSSPAAQQEVGRNDPCPCGSGKKYKRCHGA